MSISNLPGTRNYDLVENEQFQIFRILEIFGNFFVRPVFFKKLINSDKNNIPSVTKLVISTENGHCLFVLSIKMNIFAQKRYENTRK